MELKCSLLRHGAEPSATNARATIDLNEPCCFELQFGLMSLDRWAFINIRHGSDLQDDGITMKALTAIKKKLRDDVKWTVYKTTGRTSGLMVLS